MELFLLELVLELMFILQKLRTRDYQYLQIVQVTRDVKKKTNATRPKCNRTSHNRKARDN
jgi:hypothetical protein